VLQSPRLFFLFIFYHVFILLLPNLRSVPRIFPLWQTKQYLALAYFFFVKIVNWYTPYTITGTSRWEKTWLRSRNYRVSTNLRKTQRNYYIWEIPYRDIVYLRHMRTFCRYTTVKVWILPIDISQYRLLFGFSPLYTDRVPFELLDSAALLWRESCGGGSQIVFLNLTTII
jgi:hypothetical protein